MDFVSHALWGMTIVREPQLLPAVILVSNLPDFLGNVPMRLGHVREKLRVPQEGFLKEVKKALITFFLPPIASSRNLRLYRVFHNLFAWGAFSLFLFLFFPKYLILSLAWLSHILVDIPTHNGIWATRIFYPISDFHINGWRWDYNKKVIVVNLILLVLLNLIIWKIKGRF